jgi:integrase
MATRTTIAPGIRRDASGLEAEIKVHGQRRFARFPADAALEEIHAWQEKERKKLRAVDPLDRVPRGRPSETGATLEAAAGRFLPQIAGRESFKADRSHLRAWFIVMGRHHRPLGQVAITLLTTEDINLAIAQWQTAPPRREVRRIRVSGYARESQVAADAIRTAVIRSYDRQTPITSGQVVAAKTIRHRCRVLDELFRTMKIASPIDGAKIPKLPKPHPIGVPIETVRLVAQTLAASAGRSRAHAQTYARFLVLATTGQRPCQVMRTQPDDLKLETGVWIVRSAKGEPAHTITLNAHMVAAWRAFIAAAAWGVYDMTKHARHVHAAGWPSAIRPYAARHSVMMDALAAGVPLDDVQGLAGHTSPLTTRQFYGPLVVSRQRQVSDALLGRFDGVFGPRAVPADLPSDFTGHGTGKGRK